jgi:hypothetical protein
MTNLRLATSIIALGFATQGHAESIDRPTSRAAAIRQVALQLGSGKRESPAISTTTSKPRSVTENCGTGARASLPACAGSPTPSKSSEPKNLFRLGTTVLQPVAEQSDRLSNGHDITRPEHRIDVFLNNNQSRDGARSWTSTLRYERPYTLDDAWKLAFRVETPFVVTNDPNAASPSWSSGYGDTLFQAVLSKEFDDRQGFGVGLRFIAPTATGDQFGNGRWRMLPTVGYRYSLPEISPDTYFQLVARYAFDFAGDNTRRHTSELQLAPSLNIGLPEKWYITFFPSTDIRYNFIHREWFVPFNLEIGKQWSKSLLTALEVGVPFFDTIHPVYKYKIEIHVGFRF